MTAYIIKSSCLDNFFEYIKTAIRTPPPMVKFKYLLTQHHQCFVLNYIDL